MSWTILYWRQAKKDWEKIKSTGLQNKVETLLKKLQENPFDESLHREKLIGNLSGYYSCRINLQHRLVFQVVEKDHLVKIIRMWTHYDE